MNYQFLPALSDAEYAALRDDIAANGMRHPILVDEKGKILDGHHRARIAAELNFKPEREVLAGLTEAEKRDVAFTLNTARRHLDAAGRRDAVVASLKADPELSDRQHGRRTGTSHPFVAGVRAELVERGQLVTVTSRLGADGRTRPAASSGPTGVANGTPPADPDETPARRDSDPHDLPGPAVTPAGEPDQPGEVAAVGEDVAVTSPAEPPAGPRNLVAEGPSPDRPGLDEFVNDDPRVQSADYLVAFTSALSRAGGFMQFDAERIGQLAGGTTWDAIEAHAAVVAHWFETARKSRSGLRVIKGGVA